MLERVLKNPSPTLLLLLLGAFAVHALWLGTADINLGRDLTWQAYVFNGLAAAVILRVMYRLAERKNSNLGFIFMGGSLLKFLVFFIFFYPRYKSDGEISATEFASFFIPYVICLIFKSFVLIRKLNRP